MDMMIQSHCTITDTHDVDHKRVLSEPMVKGFKEIFKSIQDSSKKGSGNFDEEIDALLMQILSILGINIDIKNFDDKLPILKEFKSHRELELQSSFSMAPEQELTRILQDLLSEFREDGQLSTTNINKFFDTLKAKVPEMETIDLDTFGSSLNEVLQTFTGKESESEKGPDMKNPFASHPKIKPDKVETEENLKIPEEKSLSRKVSKEVSPEKATKEPVVPTVKEVVKNEVNGLLTMVNDVYHVEDVKPMSEDRMATISHPDSSFGDESKIFDQIVDKIELALKGEDQQVSIRLKPEYLGEVIVKVFTDKDRIKAHFFVENMQVKEMLSVHAQDFKNQVQEQGYNFSEISVYDLSESGESASFNQHFQGGSNYHQPKRSKYSFKNNEDGIEEISSKNYFDPWQYESSVDYTV